VTADARQQVLDLTSEYFPPELLNRLDTMLVFNKLSRESILQVVALRLHDVAERLSGRRITLDVDRAASEWLAEHGYSNVYGARAIARVVRTDVLFPLAQKLLRGTIRYVLSSHPAVREPDAGAIQRWRYGGGQGFWRREYSRDTGKSSARPTSRFSGSAE
jgi:ATP-dependent Clp protease ATP-binding subunit ClpA